MSEVFGFDAFSPKEIAARVDTVGAAKAHLPLLSTLMLSVLAGAFVGLGALYPLRRMPDRSRKQAPPLMRLTR
jgi:formate/nitrite transporter FocA (FNT family)